MTLAPYITVRPLKVNAIHKARTLGAISEETWKKKLQAIETCEYCGLSTDHILCQGCTKKITHDKTSLSLGHLCSGCLIENGKGE